MLKFLRKEWLSILGIVIVIGVTLIIMATLCQDKYIKELKDTRNIKVDISDELKQYDKLAKERENLGTLLALKDIEIHNIKGQHDSEIQKIKNKHEKEVERLQKEYKESIGTMTRILNAEGSGLVPEDQDINDICRLYSKRLNVYCGVYNEEN